MTIEKTVKITIEGDEVQSLSDVCELARRYITAKNGGSAKHTIDEFDLSQFRQIMGILDQVFHM